MGRRNLRSTRLVPGSDDVEHMSSQFAIPGHIFRGNPALMATSTSTGTVPVRNGISYPVRYGYQYLQGNASSRALAELSQTVTAHGTRTGTCDGYLKVRITTRYPYRLPNMCGDKQSSTVGCGGGKYHPYPVPAPTPEGKYG